MLPKLPKMFLCSLMKFKKKNVFVSTRFHYQVLQRPLESFTQCNANLNKLIFTLNDKFDEWRLPFVLFYLIISLFKIKVGPNNPNLIQLCLPSSLKAIPSSLSHCYGCIYISLYLIASS